MPPQKTPPMTPTVIVRKKRPTAPTAATTSAVRAAPATPTPSQLQKAPSPPPVARPQPPVQSQPAASSAPVAPTVPLTPPGPNRRQRDFQAQQELLAVLHQRWPQLFPDDLRQIKPFAIGIHHELIQQLPDAKPYLIRRALGFLQRNGWGAYWRAVLKGGHRYGLDGAPKGEVTADDQAYAKEQLALLRHQKRGRRPPTAPLQGQAEDRLPPSADGSEERPPA
jgi:hypothetical protein